MVKWKRQKRAALLNGPVGVDKGQGDARRFPPRLAQAQAAAFHQAAEFGQEQVVIVLFPDEKAFLEDLRRAFGRLYRRGIDAAGALMQKRRKRAEGEAELALGKGGDLLHASEVEVLHEHLAACFPHSG